MLKITNRDLVPIIIGDSSDLKPVGESVEDGTVYYDRDSKKKYTYRKSNETWYEGAAI